MLNNNEFYKTEYYEKVKPNYKDFDEFCPDYWEMTYSDRWREIVKLLPINKMTDFTMLEVGCGLGRAMTYFKSYGVTCEGIEPSDYGVSVCKQRNLNITQGDFLNVKIDRLYDVIYFEQVLSHMPDYQLALYKAWSKLEDDGILLIEEPNDFNLLQMRLQSTLGQYWVVPDHSCYFNYESLEEACDLANFKVIKKSCTYPMELYELSGRHYVGDNEAGKKLHEEKTKMLKSLDFRVRDKLLEGFVNAGIGRDIVYYCKKK
jgi:SAM-dependent methyltransferase